MLPTFKDANILIVDDKQANIDILEGFLEIQGYTNLLSTQDSRQVVDLFMSFKPDLILLDLMMPFMTGFDVMEALKNLIPSDVYFPILVLTADITQEAKQRALAGGAKDFLVKPFDLTEVDLRIKNLLEARYLHLQLEIRNKVLDEKVRERTRELEQANIDLIVARDLAEAGNRLKTAFMNNISHEVRTPMNGILGFSSLIADPSTTAEDIREFVPLLRSSCDRLINTITDYMDISLIASKNVDIHPKEFRLSEVLDELFVKYNDIINQNRLEFNTDLTPDYKEITLFTDRELFKKIFTHLLDNAIKFTSKGGITVGYSISTEFLEFFIRDTGIGISPEAQERIFNVFMQENASITRGHEGSGLGLSISRGFLDLLGGKIWMESMKGEGSTFYFTLPANSRKKDETSSSGNTAQYRTHEISVLIAEDETTNLIYAETLLRNKVNKLFTAENGFEAVEIFRANPDISLVLMDLKMPVLDGFNAMKQIKVLQPDVPVVAMTAFAMTEDEHRAVQAGFDGYIAKPFDHHELFETLTRFGLKISG